jgi:twinkle protein
MPNTDLPESEFLRHEPCPNCGSKDNLARYSDGHAYCFGCQHYEHADTDKEIPVTDTVEKSEPLADVTYRELKTRGLNEETCRLFDYGWNGKRQVATYRDTAGKILAQKFKTADKQFYLQGSGRSLPLWGMHLWSSNGKMVVVTEGEIDCMSVSQVQNNKWPVVSLPSGAAGAAASVRHSLDWLEGYESVIFMLDMDKPGQEAAIKCAELLSPGKAKIAHLPLKDANEMLTAGRRKEIISSIWNAKTYRPDGVVPGEDTWERIIEEKDIESVEYPWAGLNNKTYGMRLGEVVTLSSGTGQGKSSICREWQYWLLQKGHHVGIIALEENIRHTGRSLMGLHLGFPPHKWNDRKPTEEELKEAFESTVGSGRCTLYDHWGSLESDNLLSRIRYMARSMGCTHIFLDHLSIVVSGLGDGDERRMIDNTMTKLRSLVEELQISLVIVSHLRRPEGRSHEEGGQVSLSHLRGSGSIAQLSDIVIALERDQQDEQSKDITTLRVLKNRYTGDTGVCTWVKYHADTGRLEEIDEPRGDEDTDVADSF